MSDSDQHYCENPASEFPITLLSAGLFAPPILYFGYQRDFVLVAFLAVVGVAAVSGFKLGLLRMIGSLVGIYAAVVLAPGWGRLQAHHFNEWLGTTGLTNRFVAIGAIGLAIALGITCVFLLLSRRVFDQRPRLDASNRWTGFLVGGGQGAAAMFLLLGGMLIIEPIQRERLEQRQADPLEAAADVPQQAIHRVVSLAAEQTQASLLFPTLTRYNPFERIDQLNQLGKLQRTAQVLKDPAEVNSLLRHPAVMQLQQQPAMQAAMQSVRNDEEIQAILASGEPLDRHKAMQLLSNPAVLELVDQPQFVQTVSQILDTPEVPR